MQFFKEIIAGEYGGEEQLQPGGGGGDGGVGLGGRIQLPLHPRHHLQQPPLLLRGQEQLPPLLHTLHHPSHSLQVRTATSTTPS